MRIGFGYDVHAFSAGRPLILGGIRIPHEYGLKGHSDADVLTHAIIDALLGAMAWGDIGSWFPDTEAEYEGSDSLRLLEKVLEEFHKEKVDIINIDATIVAEKPKMRSYIHSIRTQLAATCKMDVQYLSIKATTSEKMGFIGRTEGIATHAVASVSPVEFKNIAD